MYQILRRQISLIIICPYLVFNSLSKTPSNLNRRLLGVLLIFYEKFSYLIDKIDIFIYNEHMNNNSYVHMFKS
jgi:hypothetical protein